MSIFTKQIFELYVQRLKLTESVEDLDNQIKILREEADKANKLQDLWHRIQIFANENNTEKIDWNNQSQEKWLIYAHYYDNLDMKFDLYIDKVYKRRDFQQVYFSSVSIAIKAKKTFEDELYLYYSTKNEE